MCSQHQRKKPAEESRDPATDDGDLMHLGSSKTTASCTSAKKKRTASMAGPNCYTGTMRYQKKRASEQKMTSILGKKEEGETLRNIIEQVVSKSAI